MNDRFIPVKKATELVWNHLKYKIHLRNLHANTLQVVSDVRLLLIQNKEAQVTKAFS